MVPNSNVNQNQNNHQNQNNCIGRKFQTSKFVYYLFTIGSYLQLEKLFI